MQKGVINTAYTGPSVNQGAAYSAPPPYSAAPSYSTAPPYSVASSAGYVTTAPSNQPAVLHVKTGHQDTHKQSGYIHGQSQKPVKHLAL